MKVSTMSRSWIIAGIVALGAIAWIGSGFLPEEPAENGASSEAATGPDAPADADAPQSVRVRTYTSEPMINEIIVQGRTIADRKVVVRSELDGIVEEVMVDRGERVAAGTVLARLEVDDREAALAQARAQLAAAELEYNAAAQLSERGYRAETDVARALAALDAARAAVRLAELRLDDLEIRAPFDGIVDSREIEVGDYVKSGDPAAMLIDLDPLRVAGQISERHLGAIRPGSAATVRLMGDRAVEGTVGYVASVADDQTRTFTVEVDVPNPEMAVIEGLTAELHLPLREVMAHRMTPANLHLADSGRIGVLSVDETDHVAFLPVQIIGGGSDSVWLAGLPDRVTVITVGQGFVQPGQPVAPVPASDDGNGGGDEGAAAVNTAAADGAVADAGADQ
jgi:multidrug efflux system membrane fusion protein